MEKYNLKDGIESFIKYEISNGVGENIKVIDLTLRKMIAIQKRYELGDKVGILELKIIENLILRDGIIYRNYFRRYIKFIRKDKLPKIIMKGDELTLDGLLKLLLITKSKWRDRLMIYSLAANEIYIKEVIDIPLKKLNISRLSNESRYMLKKSLEDGDIYFCPKDLNEEQKFIFLEVKIEKILKENLEIDIDIFKLISNTFDGGLKSE